MARHYSNFQAANTEVLVILGGSLDQARTYADQLHLPFPVLADPGREIYHRFGLRRALRLIQRTASVLVDPAGVIRYLKRATNPTEWLQESQALLQKAQDLAKS